MNLTHHTRLCCAPAMEFCGNVWKIHWPPAIIWNSPQFRKDSSILVMSTASVEEPSACESRPRTSGPAPARAGPVRSAESPQGFGVCFHELVKTSSWKFPEISQLNFFILNFQFIFPIRIFNPLLNCNGWVENDGR